MVRRVAILFSASYVAVVLGLLAVDVAIVVKLRSVIPQRTD